MAGLDTLAVEEALTSALNAALDARARDIPAFIGQQLVQSQHKRGVAAQTW